MNDPKYLGFASHEGDQAEDTVCLIDLSPSMLERDFRPSRLEAGKQAFGAMIDVKRKHHPDDRVGVVGFADSAARLHRLVRASTSWSSLKNTVNVANSGYGTNITAGLRLGANMLCGNLLTQAFRTWRGDQPVRRASRIILLSDGCHNTGWTLPDVAARRIKGKGVTIDVIGIGGSPTAEGFDESQLKAIASRDERGDPRYCFIGDTGGLVHKFERLARHLRPV